MVYLLFCILCGHRCVLRVNKQDTSITIVCYRYTIATKLQLQLYRTSMTRI